MKNAEINFNNDPDNPKILNIGFSGELTISNTRDFRDLIIQKIKNKKGLSITTSNVDGLDLSFYQLLLSLKKTLKEQNKPFNLKLSLPAEEEELLRQAGFDTDH